MTHYLLIESRDAHESRDVAFVHDMAGSLAGRGHEVTLFLVQNGVLAARAGAASEALTHLAGSGVSVRADEFSLRERGIAEPRLADGVQPAPLELVVDALADGCKALWH